MSFPRSNLNGSFDRTSFFLIVIALHSRPMWDALRVDVRHSLRGLRRSSGFTLVVIFTVALAIGAMTTIGSLLNAIVLRTVSATDPDRLVSISAADIRTNQAGPLYPDTFVAYSAAQQSFSEMSNPALRRQTVSSKGCRRSTSTCWGRQPRRRADSLPMPTHVSGLR
jgi:hypothetical protein